MCFHISLVLCANRRSYVKADPHFIFVVVISLFCHFEKKLYYTREIYALNNYAFLAVNGMPILHLW